MRAFTPVFDGLKGAPLRCPKFVKKEK